MIGAFILLAALVCGSLGIWIMLGGLDDLAEYDGNYDPNTCPTCGRHYLSTWGD